MIQTTDSGVLALIGNTPLIEPKRFEKALGLRAKLLLKMENFNPTGSVKDRVALAMIEDAERRHRLNNKSIIIEPTSGNAGIAIASVAAAKGYHAIITMPETMSVDRQKQVSVFGAEVVLTKGSLGMKGAVLEAERLAGEIPNSCILHQFENPANTEAHRRTTGPEIWKQTNGSVDIFIAGVGTGGTITGVGGYLKEQNPNIKVIAVEPAASPVLKDGIAGIHRIQGLGCGFVPKILDTSIYDEVYEANDAEAFEIVRRLARIEGFMLGISSGAALNAAVEIARRPENQGKTVVALMPDGGDRYYITSLFGDE